MATISVQPSIADGQTTLLRKLLQGFFDGRFVGSGGGGGGGGGAITAAAGSYAAGALGVNSIATGAISAGALALGAFAADSISAGAVGFAAIATGAFSTGSIAAGSIAAGAAVSGALVDGAITTLGTEADAVATTLPASYTVISLLKLLISGVTVAQGTAANLKAQVSVASGGIASGAVASGAVAAGAIASGAAVAGSFADGALTTVGLEADAAITNPASSGTLMAFIKGLLTSTQANANVGGKTFTIKVNPTISTSAYSAGFTVGAIQTLTNAVTKSGGTGILESLVLLDKSHQNQPMDILIFDVNPAAATTTDHATFVISTNDVNVIARVSVAASDYVQIAGGESIAVKSGLGIAVQASGSATLYAVAVTSGTPTYSANALQWVWGILQD
jgi:hypothetical protein